MSAAYNDLPVGFVNDQITKIFQRKSRRPLDVIDKSSWRANNNVRFADVLAAKTLSHQHLLFFSKS